MNTTQPYNEIFQLLGGYLNQDMYLICDCDTLEEAIEYFVCQESSCVHEVLLKDLQRFEADHSGNLEEAFEASFLIEIDYESVEELFALIRQTIFKYYPDLQVS